MTTYYRIGEFAKLIGKTPQTLRNWDRSGRLHPVKIDQEGRKLYAKEQLDEFLREGDRIIIGYCRVNDYRQSDELAKQVRILKSYMDKKEYTYEIISEIGSGLKYRRKGLQDLIRMISEKKVAKIVALRKDSMVRYGNDLIEMLCQSYGIDIEYMEDYINEDDYCDDIAAIIADFDHQIKGKKANKAKKRIRELIEG